MLFLFFHMNEDAPYILLFSVWFYDVLYSTEVRTAYQNCLLYYIHQLIKCMIGRDERYYSTKINY